MNSASKKRFAGLALLLFVIIFALIALSIYAAGYARRVRQEAKAQVTHDTLKNMVHSIKSGDTSAAFEDHKLTALERGIALTLPNSPTIHRAVPVYGIVNIQPSGAGVLEIMWLEPEFGVTGFELTFASGQREVFEVCPVWPKEVQNWYRSMVHRMLVVDILEEAFPRTRSKYPMPPAIGLPKSMIAEIREVRILEQNGRKSDAIPVFVSNNAHLDRTSD